jgi:phi13 family phage major tail protein
MSTAEERRSRVGLDSLYIAEITADTAASYTADTPAYLAPAAEASLEPSSSFEIQYADDQPYDVMTAEGETKISLTITGIDLAALADLTGRVFDSASGRIWDNGGTPPYFALSFRSLKANGKYRYYQFLKVMFSMPKEEMTTRGEKPEPKTVEITATAIRTTYKWNLGSVTDSIKRVVGDEDTLNFSATGWFSAVQTPSYSAPSALALSSSVPIDTATGVLIASNQTLTFNNSLLDSAIYNVALIDPSDGSVIASAISLDTAKKVVTINPNASLATSTAHLIVYAVIDIYGQHLAGSINFTTAAP